MNGEIKSIAQGKKIAKQGLIFQILISIIIVVLATVFFDAQIGVSVAFGAIVSLLPNAVFSLFAFRFSGAQRSHAVARSFSQGSKVKLALTFGLFVVAFAGLSLPPLPVFFGLASTTIVYWTVLIRYA